MSTTNDNQMMCSSRDYSRKLFWAVIPYGRERVTNAAWVHAEGVPNAARGLGGSQGAKPPKAPRFYALVMPEMALKIAENNHE